MNIVQCKMCRKPFDGYGGRICPDCLKKIDKDFVTVRDYIYENKRANMDEVSEETGVEKAVIMYLLKEGRLTLIGDDAGVLLCEVCKRPINSGRMCEKCKNTVASTMQKSVGPDKQEAPKKNTADAKISQGMHTTRIKKLES